MNKILTFILIFAGVSVLFLLRKIVSIILTTTIVLVVTFSAGTPDFSFVLGILLAVILGTYIPYVSDITIATKETFEEMGY